MSETTTGPPGPPAPGEDYTARATAAITEAARNERDFAEWLTHLLAAVAGEMGSSYALIAGRPGSWESANLAGLLASAVGGNDEYLPLPQWRTRAPEFAHEAYGLRVGAHDVDQVIIAAGHVDPRRFLAAASHFARHEWGGIRLGDDFTAERPAQVLYTHAAHAPESTEQEWRLVLGVAPGSPGSFPITVLED